ncbi:MAG: LLM class flavin-dependent oxidoreductase [Actinobacteria bacterium]|nr:LLM class flavin-dependent oxidoreductase [Actinomycetota bacterium]
MRFGVWIYPVAPAERIVEAIRRLDDAGVDEVWIADEGVARDPLALFAAAAPLTSTIRFGVGITSPLLRHPGAVASTAMTVDELSNGRLTVGWGVGGHESLEPFGLSTERPVGVVRDALRTARAVMRGQSATDYTPPAHAAPPRAIPQFVGARGEQLNRLASREADGVFLSGFEHHDIGRVIGLARSHRPIAIALYQSVRFTTPEDRWSIAGSPASLATRVASLASEFSPDSLGLALVDGADLGTMIDGAIETIGHLRLHFARGA